MNFKQKEKLKKFCIFYSIALIWMIIWLFAFLFSFDLNYLFYSIIGTAIMLLMIEFFNKVSKDMEAIHLKKSRDREFLEMINFPMNDKDKKKK